MAEPAEPKGQYITELNKNDVLCGRGSGPNERVGNIHFRDLVSTRKAEYLAINPRDHKNKNRIAREIVETVRSRGGQFLKRAAVEHVEGEPESYELADEPAVLEKAKQALRQNRAGSTNATKANGSAEKQPDVVMAEQIPSRHSPAVTSNPYQAFMAHLQQASMPQSSHLQQASMPQSYGVSPAEAAMQNLHMQSFMAQHHDSIPPGQDAYVATSGATTPVLPDPQQSYRESFAMLQHFKAQQQQQALPHPSMSGYPNLAASSAGLAGEAEIRYYLEQQRQHTMNMQANSRAAAVETAAASISRSKREQSNHSVSSFSLNSAGSSDSSVSNSRMKALEMLFVNASQNMPASSVESRSQHHHHRTYTREHSQGTVAEGSFAEGLEDMSLPSMSIGEISDFTPLGESLSRSKRSAGGTIIESSERSSSSMSWDGSANFARVEGNAVGTGMLSQERNRGYDANRHVSFTGSEGRNMQNEAAAVYAHATQQQQTSHPYHSVHRNTNQSISSQSAGSKHSAAQKKQRRSLSAYYRELRTAHATPGDCPSAVDNNDAMSSIDEDGWR